MTIAERIQERLTALGMSESSASKAAGLSRASVAAILAGKSISPRVATLAALAPVLQCSLAYLACGTPHPSSAQALAHAVIMGDRAVVEGGMSLRDWFAGQALVGMLGGGFADTIPHDDANGGGDAAFFAYQYADAMLAARSTDRSPT